MDGAGVVWSEYQGASFRSVLTVLKLCEPPETWKGLYFRVYFELRV